MRAPIRGSGAGVWRSAICIAGPRGDAHAIHARALTARGFRSANDVALTAVRVDGDVDALAAAALLVQAAGSGAAVADAHCRGRRRALAIAALLAGLASDAAAGTAVGRARRFDAAAVAAVLIRAADRAAAGPAVGVGVGVDA